MKTIRAYLLIAFLTCALGPLVGTGLVLRSAIHERTEAEILQNLDRTLTIKQEALDAMLHEIARGAEIVTRNNDVLAFYGEGGETAELRATRAVRDFQESMWGRLHHVFLTDLEGHVILSPPHGDSKGSHLDHIVEHPDFVYARQGKRHVTDFFGFHEKNHFHQLHLEPIRSPDGKQVGVLVAEVVITAQEETLSAGLDLGEGDVAYMAAMDGRRIVNNRDEAGPPLDRAGISKAIASGHAVEHFEDETGRQIIGFYLHDKSRPWVVALEVDRERAFATVAALEQTTAIAVIIAGLIVIVAALWISARIAGPIRGVAKWTNELAEGRLSRLEACQSSIVEIKELYAGGACMSDSLREMISNLTQTTNTVSHASTRILGGSEAVAQLSGRQVATTEDASSSLSEIEAMTANNAEGAKNAQDLTEGVVNSVQAAHEGMIALEESMRTIESSVKKVSKINTEIDDIAFQTTLLSLNASVEAARAGEVGRGFAVVAEEVRSLAGRCAESANGTRELIETAVENVSQGAAAAHHVREVLNRVNELTESLHGKAQEITTACTEQAIGVSRLHDGVQDIERSTHEGVAQAKESAETARELDGLVNDLQVFVDRSWTLTPD